MTITRECEVGVTMMNEIVQCVCPVLPLNRQVSVSVRLSLRVITK